MIKHRMTFNEVSYQSYYHYIIQNDIVYDTKQTCRLLRSIGTEPSAVCLPLIPYDIQTSICKIG